MTEPLVVYVCECIIPGQEGMVTHIFSSMEKLMAWSETDDRVHVVWDCLVDCPERMEGLTQ